VGHGEFAESNWMMSSCKERASLRGGDELGVVGLASDTCVERRRRKRKKELGRVK